METKIEKEKARGAKLKQKVQFLSSLNTEDQVGQQRMPDAFFFIYISNCNVTLFLLFSFCADVREKNLNGCSLKRIETTQLRLSSLFVPQDSMLENLDAKVAEVQRCLVEDRSSNQTTLEKLATIENCMSTVLQGLESMPEESLKMLKKIMDRERRTRSDGFLGSCERDGRFTSTLWF